MRFLSIFLCCLLLAGCAAPAVESTPETTAETVTLPAPTEPADPLRLRVSELSLKQRVGQLFLARCSGNPEDISQYYLGGLVLFGNDFANQNPDSMRQTLATYQAAAEIPLLIAVDEEGGDVTRISQNKAFRSKRFTSPRKCYNAGGLEAVLTEEEEKCQLLRDLGISVNLGPVCDITTQADSFLYSRSLGLDPQTTSDVISSTVRLMDAYYVGSVLKHFPGYGNNGDTHTGIVVDDRSLESLEKRDLIPFQAGIDAGCDAIMVGHIITEAMDSELPASLSPAVHQYLRETMHFSGVIITDDLVMQAITDRYGAGESAVMAVLAGNDLLCSTEFAVQYDAVYNAVLDGRIPEEMLNDAVYRVLKWKQSLGLLSE